jgi:uncharacterized protein
VTLEQIFGFALAVMAMLIGVVGSVLPAIPGTPLIFLVALAHRFYFGNAGASNLVLAVLLLIMLLSLAIDFLFGMLGAKKLGATWRGVLGAVLGAIAGLFFGLPGLVLGPFLGALTFEMLGKREFNDAARAGVGAVIGLFVGAIGKLACAVAMTGIFSLNVVSRASG